MKYAIVDLGSNTIRLSLYQTYLDGSFRLLFSEKETAGIAGYISGGVLSPEGMERAAGVLLQFRALLENLGEERLYVFATASLRNIRNTGEAVEAIRRRAGVKVEVLSGEEEARMGYQGALLACGPDPAGAMFDIGGGSSEVLVARDGAVQKALSLPVGSLNLFNQYVSKLWPKEGELTAIRRKIREEFAAAGLIPGGKKTRRLCGVGGTARAVLKIANARYQRDPGERTLTPAQVERFWACPVDEKGL